MAGANPRGVDQRVAPNTQLPATVNPMSQISTSSASASFVPTSAPDALSPEQAEAAQAALNRSTSTASAASDVAAAATGAAAKSSIMTFVFGADRLGSAASAAGDVASSLSVMNAALSAAERYENGPRVAQSGAGHVMNSLAHAAVDFASTAKDFSSPAASIAALVDAAAPADAAAKPLIAGVVAAMPSNAAMAGAHAYIDAVQVGATAMTGDVRATYRAGEALDEAALRGTYGPAAQAGSMVSGIVFEPVATSRALTGPEAESGAYGPFVALGNRIGDALYAWTQP